MPGRSTLFELLAADDRRRILLLLCQVDSIQIPEGLVRRGESQRTKRDDRERPSESRDFRSMRIQLVHTHLPKLEAEGLVEWDRESHTVSRGPEFDEVEPALHALALNTEKFPDGLF